VCGIDSFCCVVAWDEICCEEAENECGAICLLGCAPTDGGSADGGGDDFCISNCCCPPNDGLGCDFPACEDCVCGLDSFCCEVLWDESCCEAAETVCGETCLLGCGIVGDGGADANCCCPPEGGLGCADEVCEDCVCGLDSFCCEVEWDLICCQEAENECGPACLPGCGELPG
jgi:hypothetical protein